MLSIFGHAGEAHETVAEAATHNVLTAWYIVLPLFILCMFGIGTIVYLLSRKSKTVTFNIVLAILFIAGVGFYKTSAPVSVLALSGGFALALLQVIISLSKPERHGK